MNIEIPDILSDRLGKFSPSELEKLRLMLSSPEYLKLLSVAECMKPSANCSGAGSSQRDAFSGERATARLGEIRGWELHTAAILAALSPKIERRMTEENFQPAEVSVQPQPENQK